MITIEIGNLEVELGGLLSALLHIQREIGEIIYLTPRAALARIALIENITKATMTDGTDGYKSIMNIVGRAKTVIGKRHSLVHELWGVHKTSKQVHRMTLPPKETAPSKPVSISQLTNLIEDIRELAQDTKEITEIAFKAWPPYTWQATSPAP